MTTTTINPAPTPLAQLGTIGFIGFIGIGNMGFVMMARQLSQDWPVFAHDIEATRLKEAVALGANQFESNGARSSKRF